MIASGALASGLINENTSFLSSGGIRIGGWFFPDWRSGGHGATNVKKAIAQSVNTFFYIIGGGYNGFNGLGLNGIAKYAKIFGLGEKTGIDLPGEIAGFVPTEEWKKKTTGEPWYIGDTYHIAIGQGFLLTTPLQMALITATIANGGTLYTPTVLERPTENRVRGSNIIPASALSAVQKGMRETVLTGSGRSLLTLPITSAGKTGTAQTGEDKRTLAWYVGYAPYEHPELIVTVMVEEGGEGHATAAPIAKTMLQKYFGVQEIQKPLEPTPIEQNAEEPLIPLDIPPDEVVPGAPAP
jgi:penicillin-binding protein 2